MARIREIVNQAHSQGLSVILDIHEIPGYVRFSGWQDWRLWNDAMRIKFENLLVRIWKQLAREFSGEAPYSIAYELLNEPNPKLSESGSEDMGWKWDALQTRLITAIRQIDTVHTIICAPPYSWRLSALSSWSPPARVLQDGKIAVSFHIYIPFDFTGQWESWWDRRVPFRKYPGYYARAIYEGDTSLVYWDRSRIRIALQKAAEFQVKYPDIPLYCAEFSANRLAPGASLYLRDVIAVLKELWIGWTYHAYGELAYLQPITGTKEVPWDLEMPLSGRLEVVKKGFVNLK